MRYLHRLFSCANVLSLNCIWLLCDQGRSGSWMVLWRPTRPFRTNIKKRCIFHYRGQKCKSRKSRNTWSNRQISPWSTKWSRGRRLIEFCQENALVIANTPFQQHKRRLYTWTSPDGQYEIRLIIFFAVKDGETLYSQQKQDQELTVVHPYWKIHT